MPILAAAKSMSSPVNGGTYSATDIINPADWLVDAMNGSRRTASGIRVTEDNTITLSAIFDGIRLLAESEAQLPLKVFRYTTRSSNTEPFYTHPAFRLLYRRPNPYMNSFQFRKFLRKEQILGGNGYAVIERNNRNAPIAMWPVRYDRVQPYVNERKELRYLVDGANDIPAEDMIHRIGYTENGYVGIPLFRVAADSIGHMLATERFGSRFFGNGANISGIIKSKRYLKDQQAVDRVKRSFVAQTTGMDNAMSVALLEDDMDWQRLGVSPDEAQFLGTRTFNIAEVARWLNIPVPMVKEMGRATFSNLEQLDIQFVKYSLNPSLTDAEQEYEEKLLTTAEKQSGDVLIKHNVKGLLRGDTKTQAEWYRTMFQTAAYSPNKILESEDEPTYEGGDMHFVHSGAIPIEQIGRQNEA